MFEKRKKREKACKLACVIFMSEASEEELEDGNQQIAVGEPHVQMATFGTIGEFVEGNEDWTEYEKGWDTFSLLME